MHFWGLSACISGSPSGFTPTDPWWTLDTLPCVGQPDSSDFSLVSTDLPDDVGTTLIVDNRNRSSVASTAYVLDLPDYRNGGWPRRQSVPEPGRLHDHQWTFAPRGCCSGDHSTTWCRVWQSMEVYFPPSPTQNSPSATSLEVSTRADGRKGPPPL